MLGAEPLVKQKYYVGRLFTAPPPFLFSGLPYSYAGREGTFGLFITPYFYIDVLILWFYNIGVLLLNFDCLVHQVECQNVPTTNCNLENG